MIRIYCGNENCVASFTDAWIETEEQKKAIIESYKSHLLQMRGLKQSRFLLSRSDPVASFTDAWIETIYFLRKRIKFSRIFYRCVD